MSPPHLQPSLERFGRSHLGVGPWAVVGLCDAPSEHMLALLTFVVGRWARQSSQVMIFLLFIVREEDEAAR